MSSRPTGDEDEPRDVQDRRPLPSAARPSTLVTHHHDLAILLRDDSNWLSHIRALRESEVIILLTPVVIPISQDPDDTSDPFEPLGRALARRHQRVRQVPYTQRNGITSTHLGFIKRGHVVILCFAVEPSQQLRDYALEAAGVVFAVNDNKPCIIVVCCSPINREQDVPFPTVIQTEGYSIPALEATVELIFGEQTQAISSQPSGSQDIRSPKLWKVEEWDEVRDLSNVHHLWKDCVSPKFAVDQSTLAQLLRRPGYAKHYVVRGESGRLLGFCATYLSYVDQEGEKLIASLAVLLIQPTYRSRGVGLSLHAHATAQLKRTRGVTRLQLGSTYPRVLYGPPFDMYINEDWFRRRGWQLNAKLTYDLLLDIEDWPASANLPPTDTITFRQCTQDNMDEVLVLIEKAAARQARTGWFDQYWSLMDSSNVKDVLIGIEDSKIIAAALTYTPSSGSQIASNLPWAGRIGSDVGGVTCICVYPNPQDSTAIGILDACVQKLKAEGMMKVFMDAITEDIDDLARLGFKEWARYRDVWKDA